MQIKSAKTARKNASRFLFLRYAKQPAKPDDGISAKVANIFK